MTKVLAATVTVEGWAPIKIRETRMAALTMRARAIIMEALLPGETIMATSMAATATEATDRTTVKLRHRTSLGRTILVERPRRVLPNAEGSSRTVARERRASE